LRFIPRLKIATVVLAFLIIHVVFFSTSFVESNSLVKFQPAHATTDHGINFMSNSDNSSKDYIFGTIASLQNDENGNLTWILSGNWRTNILTQLIGNPIKNSSSAGLPLFDAFFDMVLTNGSAKHQHRITNFTLTGASLSNNNMTLVFNGTSTVTMKDGPIENVLSNITILDNSTVSIWLDPTLTNDHFGETPIYGTVRETTMKNETSR
jgi:hypothetical protein